jgi:hypothetical protein
MLLPMRPGVSSGCIVQSVWKIRKSGRMRSDQAR